MTGAQIAAGLLACIVVAGYFCRMDAFSIKRDHPAMGLIHFLGFAAASWVGCEALTHELGPLHGVALLGAAAWLGGSYWWRHAEPQAFNFNPDHRP